jgi:hypothetical protein
MRTLAGQVGAVDRDRPGVRPPLASDEADQGGFAGPVRPDKAVDGAGPHRQADVLNHVEAFYIAERDMVAVDGQVRASLGGRQGEVLVAGFWGCGSPGESGPRDQASHQARQALGEEHDDQDEQRAEQEFLPQGAEVHVGREHADEGRPGHRAEGGVDAAQDDHDQDADRDVPAELAGRDDAEEGEAPAGQAGQRRRQAEHADLDRRGAHPGRGRERLSVVFWAWRNLQGALGAR